MAKLLLGIPRLALPILSLILQSIPLASAAFVVRLQNSFVHKALDFAEGGVVAGVDECGGFFGGEGLDDSAGEDFVDELLLAFAEGCACVGVAELDVVDFCGEELFAVLDGLAHHLQEPQNPFGEVAACGLRARENFEVVCFVLADLLVQRILAMRCVFGAGELHRGNGTGDSAVGVGEGADGQEPKVRDGGFDDSVHVRFFEPRDEAFHFALEAFWIGAYKVECLFV